MLDYTQTSDILGKPASVDLTLGLATAPVLYAAEDYPELRPMIERKFKNAGDVEYARNCVDKSEGLEKTKLLASKYCNSAIEAISTLNNSDAKDSLVHLANCVLYREK